MSVILVNMFQKGTSSDYIWNTQMPLCSKFPPKYSRLELSDISQSVKNLLNTTTASLKDQWCEIEPLFERLKNDPKNTPQDSELKAVENSVLLLPFISPVYHQMLIPEKSHSLTLNVDNIYLDTFVDIFSEVSIY